MKWFSRLIGMRGRLALASEAEAECLAHYASMEGDYIEIGTLWGGTALIAALSKEDIFASGNVMTIDRMTGGWWNGKDPSVGRQPTPGDVLSNFAQFHVAHRINVVMAESDPWPISDSVVPSVVFIDGDHSYEGAKRDWMNVRTRAECYVIFHDYNSDKHPGVKRVVDEIARKDGNWNCIQTTGTMIVFERAASTRITEILSARLEAMA